MIKKLNESIKIFSDNLKKIYDVNFKITTNESLSVGIENFQSLIFSHFNMLEKYISTINTDIINPLNALQDNQ